MKHQLLTLLSQEVRVVCLAAASCKLETLSTTDPTVRASLTCPLVSKNCLYGPKAHVDKMKEFVDSVRSAGHL